MKVECHRPIAIGVIDRPAPTMNDGAGIGSLQYHRENHDRRAGAEAFGSDRL
jgi:hypothetical protein